MNIKSKLLNLEKKSILLHKAINIYRWLHIAFHRMKFFSSQMYRKYGGKQTCYHPLLKLKNAYSGQRCFILATGPSLKIEDVLLLRNEVTFGMNSICKLYSKTDWRPTFFGIQDIFVYDKLADELKTVQEPTVFIGNNIASKRIVPKEWIRFPLDVWYHAYDQYINQKFFAKFSANCYEVVYDGFSITYSLIQLAVYMGFKEIYLLGADCTFSSKGGNHFAEHGANDIYISSAQERNFVMYRKAKEYADIHGIKIYNATRGGALEVFPRVCLENIFGLKKL